MTFPRTILDFQQRFATNAACWDYLAKVRWPDGFICPRCGAVEYTFRFNRRGNPQAAFLAVLGISSHRGGPTYEKIYDAGEEAGWIHPNPIRS